MCYLQRNTWFFLLFCFFSGKIWAQEGNINIKQNAMIDSLMVVKIDFDREQYERSYYTIQIFYGVYGKVQQKMDVFKETFPDIEVDLSFETPNYKLQAGRFKEKITAYKALDKIKKEFPSAFLLTKR